jgi:hypothetical protein
MRDAVRLHPDLARIDLRQSERLPPPADGSLSLRYWPGYDHSSARRDHQASAAAIALSA